MSLPLRYTLLNPFHRLLRRIGTTWISLRYLKAYGHRMRKDNPETYHEKVYWLMNNTDISRWSELADKYLVRDFVARRVGEHVLPKLYGVWERPEDIDFSKIPVPCVIKTNNGCATNIFVHTREELKPESIVSQLKKYLSIHYGDLTAERHYTGIKPRVICEEMMIDQAHPGQSLIDYKFHCFDGEPKFCEVLADRIPNTHLYKQMMYDMDFKPQPHLLDFTGTEVGPITDLVKPPCWEHLKAVARALSLGFTFVRVDLYCINGHTMFGEMSFTPGVDHAYTEELTSYMGSLIKLPEKR